ncbi:MAG: hypothetical protein KKE01_01600 [Candidatus Omnitrophica bacterium]|nr:hypothetical protein [Candidatus Omnitrophota bacterium]
MKMPRDIGGAFSRRGMSTPPPISPLGEARIYFDSNDNVLKVSENGGNYINLLEFVKKQTDWVTVDAGSGVHPQKERYKWS